MGSRKTRRRSVSRAGRLLDTSPLYHVDSPHRATISRCPDAAGSPPGSHPSRRDRCPGEYGLSCHHVGRSSRAALWPRALSAERLYEIDNVDTYCSVYPRLTSRDAELQLLRRTVAPIVRLGLGWESRLGVAKQHVYELARREKLPAVRFGKHVRFRPSDLREWIARRREDGLDMRSYTVYSRLGSGRQHDGPGATTNPKATRTDPGGTGPSARRSRQQRRPVGAGRGPHPGGDGPADPPAGEAGAEEEA